MPPQFPLFPENQEKLVFSVPTVYADDGETALFITEYLFTHDIAPLGGDPEEDVIEFFDDMSYEVIKANLQHIDLVTIKNALKVMNDYRVSCFRDGDKTVNKYLELIIKKEEMINNNINNMKKIIRDNNMHDTVNKVVKANNLPKYVTGDIKKFLGGKVNSRTTIIRRKRRKTNNISNKKSKIKSKMSKKKPQKKINTKKKNNRRKKQ